MTPGPWKINETLEDANGCVVESAAGRMVCECYEDGESSTEEDRANARLISAAPDLLQALREIVSEYDTDEYRAEPESILSGRAAIAKAEGRA